MPKDLMFTWESVNEGHPDKVCDQIADAILDSLLAQDPDSRVAVECMISTGSVHVAGEVTTRGFADVQKIARTILREVGYSNPDFGIDWQDAGVWVSLHEQSREIAESCIETLVRSCFPLTPSVIITALDLKRPIYRKPAVFGHFGRLDPDFTWERTDKVAELRKEAGL